MPWNLYQWLPDELYDILVPAGTIWCTVMVFFFVTIAYKSRAQLTDERMVEWATLTVLVVPYFMPKMHDRFFFPADILSVLLAFYCPSLFVVPIAICAVSFFSYFPFFFGYELIPLRYLALVLPVLMGLLTRRLLQRAPD